MENKTPPMPAKRALAALDQPAPAEPVNKALRITNKVRRAIDLMVSGECKQINETAEKVGLARESLSRALSKPHVIEHLRQKVKVFGTHTRPGRPERNRAARSFGQLRRFHHGFNSDKVFGTHRPGDRRDVFRCGLSQRCWLWRCCLRRGRLNGRWARLRG
jgi:hypothetical protein